MKKRRRPLSGTRSIGGARKGRHGPLLPRFVRMLLTIWLCLAVFLPAPSGTLAIEEDQFRKASDELHRIDRLISKGKVKEAERRFVAVKKQMACSDDPSDYCAPQYIIRSIYYVDNRLHERPPPGGYSKFKGKVTDSFGNTAGYFDVTSKKETITFVYDAYVTNAERPNRGSTVTVYYDDERCKETCIPAKVIVHKKR